MALHNYSSPCVQGTGFSFSVPMLHAQKHLQGTFNAAKDSPDQQQNVSYVHSYGC